MGSVVSVIILLGSVFITSIVLKVINRGTIGTTQAYFSRAIAVWIISVCLMGFLVKPFLQNEKDSQSDERDVIEADMDSDDIMAPENENYFDDEMLQAEDEETDYSEYLFPDSDSRYLEESDLEGLDGELLRIARNEIFARHGRRFDSVDLQSYFDTCSWYEGDIEPEEFDAGVLNEYEKANMKFIKEHE